MNNMLPYQNILIIGNACCLLGSSAGHKIDTFDGDILRFNDFIISGYENDVGTRTNIWFTSAKYASLRYKKEDPIYIGKPTVIYCSYSKPSRAQLNAINAKWIGNNIIKQARDNIKFESPTSGIMAISWAMDKGYKNIYITNFDFYGDPLNIHYYEKNMKKEYRVHKKYHRDNNEKVFIQALVDTNRIKWFRT